MLVTVFTPSYNRGYTLENLYQSLLRQTNKDFCWLIVDDGSTDNTQELVKRWIYDNQIPIRYYKQKNQGKPVAHNKGVELTETELFTCVDSDDYLTDNAIEEICNAWKTCDEKCIGLVGYIESRDGVCLTKFDNPNVKQTTLRNFYDLGMTGDTILVFKSEILKKHLFPQFEGEKFIPEGYLYDLLDLEGQLKLLPKPIYVYEYLPDGYTANMAKLLYNNPQGYFCYINQRLHLDTTIRQRIPDSIRYVAMALAHNDRCIIKNAVYPWIAFVSYPAGWLFYVKRYRRLKKGE